MDNKKTVQELEVQNEIVQIVYQNTEISLDESEMIYEKIIKKLNNLPKEKVRKVLYSI